MPGPLHGIRIVDFGIYQNGPSATARMADEGAEVIKVESFDGDGIRLQAPPGKMNAGFESYNRGKRGLALDLKHPDAASVFRRLVCWADVLTENFRPGILDRLGFSYEQCRSWNPRLIYASNSGFGPVGELAQRPSYDTVAQAFTGVAAVMGGGRSHPPQLVEWQFSDEIGAQHFYGAVIAALFARERASDGRGQHLVTSQTAATLFFQRAKFSGTLKNGKQRDTGKASGQGGDFFKSSDGRWFLVAPTTAKNRSDFHEIALGTSGKASQEELAKALIERPMAEWLERFAQKSVPAAPVNDYFDITNSEHLRDNGYVRDFEHPKWGKVTTITAPTVFSETPVDNEGASAGPDIGEHSRECLGLLGFEPVEVERLLRSGAAQQAVTAKL